MLARTLNPLAALTAALWMTASVLAAQPVAALAEKSQLAELWEAPHDLATRDLFNGPWGTEHAPDLDATYEFVAPKRGGINPGMTVRDPQGREWKVKQPPLTGRNAEGPIEVVLSRVLSAVGHHQPPVYLLPSFVPGRRSSHPARARRSIPSHRGIAARSR